MRVYIGRPLVNSVSGKQAVMDAVFPLAREYGGALVALTLDEKGIPDTVEGRVDIAQRIVREAARYGIRSTDLFFDALTLTVATDTSGPSLTLPDAPGTAPAGIQDRARSQQCVLRPAQPPDADGCVPVHGFGGRAGCGHSQPARFRGKRGVLGEPCADWM